MIVENNLSITKKINRRYEKKFAQEGNKIGDSLNIRLPVRWVGREGENMHPEGIQERSVLMKIDQADRSGPRVQQRRPHPESRAVPRAVSRHRVRVDRQPIDKAVCEQYKTSRTRSARRAPSRRRSTRTSTRQCPEQLRRPAGQAEHRAQPAHGGDDRQRAEGPLPGGARDRRAVRDRRDGPCHRLRLGHGPEHHRTPWARSAARRSSTARRSRARTIVTDGWTAAARRASSAATSITFALTDGVNPQPAATTPANCACSPSRPTPRRTAPAT
jgi:hypothetical protein